MRLNWKWVWLWLWEVWVALLLEGQALLMGGRRLKFLLLVGGADGALSWEGWWTKARWRENTDFEVVSR